MKKFIFITTFLFSGFALQAFAAPIDAFVMRVDSNNPGLSASTQFVVPYNPAFTYSYNVDCNDDGINEAVGQTNIYVCDFPVPGIYDVVVTGVYPHVYFNNGGDVDKVLELAQWGTQSWLSMNSAFEGADNMIITAIDTPDLSMVTDMSEMFQFATSMNSSNLITWNTANITNMSAMFFFSSFNQDIGGWDTSNVTNMSRMFLNTSFNQDIGGWDTSSVSDMSLMFTSNTSFNQDVSSWDTSSLSNALRMFLSASAFNQDLSTWNVEGLTNASQMFINSGLDDQNYTNILNSWGGQNLQPSVVFHAGSARYFCSAIDARDSMTTNDSWLIFDAGLFPCVEFGDDLSGSEDSILNTPTLLINGNLAAPEMVDVSDLGTGSASIGVDYNFVSPTSVSIPVGVYDGTVATAIDITGLSIAVDNDVEVDESINLGLTNPTGSLMIGDSDLSGGIKSNLSYLIINDDVEDRPASVRYVCKDKNALNYDNSTFARHRDSKCEYEKEVNEENPFGGQECSTELIVTDNMKRGDRNGNHSSYNKGTVTQINILQTHMNRLLLDEYGNQASGPVDGIYGPLTERGVKRLQKRLNQLLPNRVPLVIDGIVGYFTKAALNTSC